MNSDERLMKETAKALSKLFHGLGFVLLVFDFRSPISNYVSNANRQDMIKALRETADTLENQKDIPATIGEA